MKKHEKLEMRPRKARHVVCVVVAFILCAVIIIAGVILIKVQALNKDAVPIVTKPTDQTGLTSSSETTLVPIDGTPTDIDTDYTVDVDDPTTDPIYQIVPIDENTINVLLVGYDARPDEKGGRSDSMMLVSYNRQQSTLRLVSFMRDTWVRIDGHDWNRINAAFSFGGIGLSINTVNDNFNLDVQNYVTIRFEQFVTIVDQLGGIEVNLSEAEIAVINNADPKNLLDTQAGVKLLNGQQTLTHCRNRKVGSGDFDRTRRQRETMLAMIQKMKKLRDPIVLSKLINFALDNVQTNIQPNELFTLAMEALGASQLMMQDARVPFDKTWYYADEDGRSVIAIDLAKNKTKLHQFLYG